MTEAEQESAWLVLAPIAQKHPSLSPKELLDLLVDATLSLRNLHDMGGEPLSSAQVIALSTVRATIVRARAVEQKIPVCPGSPVCIEAPPLHHVVLGKVLCEKHLATLLERLMNDVAKEASLRSVRDVLSSEDITHLYFPPEKP